MRICLYKLKFHFYFFWRNLLDNKVISWPRWVFSCYEPHYRNLWSCSCSIFVYIFFCCHHNSHSVQIQIFCFFNFGAFILHAYSGCLTSPRLSYCRTIFHIDGARTIYIYISVCVSGPGPNDLCTGCPRRPVCVFARAALGDLVAWVYAGLA